jgi:hypothetical protein
MTAKEDTAMLGTSAYDESRLLTLTAAESAQ